MQHLPSIIVVHGALGSSSQMAPIATALGALGIVHNVELPGHGDTPLPHDAEFSINTFVERLHAKVREIAIVSTAKPLIFGYSMGGYVALTLETQHPGTFGAILTLGTKFAWSPAVASREGGRLNADVITEKVPKFAATLEARHAEAGGWKLLLQQTAGVLSALGELPVLTKDSLGRVRALTCVALGDRDDTMTVDEAREYASFIPGAQFELLADTPHPIERVPVSDIVTLMRSKFL